PIAAAMPDKLVALAKSLMPGSAKKSDAGRLWTYFVVRRGARLLIADHPAWAADGTELRERLTVETQSLTSLLAAELGTTGPPQLDVRQAGAPNHLDLADAVHARSAVRRGPRPKKPFATAVL